MARSYPDLNLQLGAGFNCAANGFISVEIKGFSPHRGEVCSCSTVLPVSTSRETQEWNPALAFFMILPWSFYEVVFLSKNGYKPPMPLAVCKNASAQASSPEVRMELPLRWGWLVVAQSGCLLVRVCVSIPLSMSGCCGTPVYPPRAGNGALGPCRHLSRAPSPQG